MSSSLPGWLRKSSDSCSSSSSSSSLCSAGSEGGISSGYDSSDEETSRRILVSDGILSQLPHAVKRLPAALRAAEIQEAISRNRVVCILGDTGCGKSTVIPYILSTETSVKILCTQPRRMAAISLCEHVQTKFFKQRNHEAVGYRVRGHRSDSEESRIVYVTAGYLKTMLTHDPGQLREFTHLILDEVHERGIDSDFLSLIVKRLLSHSENESIKLIVMSATLQSDLFVEYFSSLNESGQRPVTVNLTMGSRISTNKIEALFLEDIYPRFTFAEACLRSFPSPSPSAEGGVIAGDLTEGAQNLAVEIALASSRNNYSTLIFLPGLGEIFSIYDKLVDAMERRNERLVPIDEQTLLPPQHLHYFHIFILHSSMPYEEQKLALKEPALNARHIVLCTNVAESSLTVPNVDVVIDSGLRRANSYDPINRVYRLTTVWCSKASCLQRRGRTGRVCNGKYFQLFPRCWFETQMSAFDTPEVLLSDLSSVFLNAKYISEFWRQPESSSSVIVRPSEILRELITPPKQRNVTAAVKDLFEAGILRHHPDEMSELSLLGTLATRLHVEPQIARVLYFSWLAGMTCEGIILAAACGLDTDVIRSTGTKYHPGNEEQYCKSIGNYMWYRAGYDLGSLSEPISVRNLLWSWLAHHFGLKEAPEFHKAAVYAKEFDTFKRSVYNHCVQFSAWIQEEIGDETAGSEAEMLKELLSERSLTSSSSLSFLSSGESLLEKKVFKCGRNFEKLKAILVIAMNNRLVTADAIGTSGEFSFDPNHSLRFEKLSEQVFVACNSERDRISRMTEVALKLTGRSAESVFILDRQSELGVNTNWIVFPGRDYLSSREAEEIRRTDPTEFHRIKDDVHITLNPDSEYHGLLMPVAVRTCVQVFDRRYTTQLEVKQREKIRIKSPKYTNGLNWGRISSLQDDISPSTTTHQWLGINVNCRSPVGWLHKIPLHLRDSSTDRFWGVAGKVIGSTRSVFEDVLPTEARAYNVTILPVAKGGRVGTALLLAALPFQSGLEAQVAVSDQGNYEVLRVKIQGRFFELNRCQKYPLTLKMLRAVSAVRRLISKAIDIPGTCIRRRLANETADDGNNGGDGNKLRISQDAMKIVNEIQSVSLSHAIENLLYASFSETATSIDLFPAGTTPIERRVMLIPNSGASYGELTLDPTVWTDPDLSSSSWYSHHPKRPVTIFRKDQIAEIIKNASSCPGLVSDKDKQEAPIIRLSALGFCVHEISRFLERKPKFIQAQADISRIMDPDLNEDEIFATCTSPDWMKNSLHATSPFNSSFHEANEENSLTALEIQRILNLIQQEDHVNLLKVAAPKRSPPCLPQSHPESPSDKEDEFDNWNHVSLEKLNSPMRNSNIATPPSNRNRSSVQEKRNQSQLKLAQLWREIENEFIVPTCGAELTPQQRLKRIWNSIQLSSNTQDI